MFKDNCLFGLLVVLACIILVGSLVFSVVASFNDHEYTVTITDKDRIVETSVDETSSKYLIFAEEKDGNTHVFENTDNFFRFKWNSSDIQGDLKVGETYTIKVVGYRVPFLSWYENIIDIR